jgi:hypothetical protein
MKNAIKIKRYKLPENICQIFSRADGFQRTLRRKSERQKYGRCEADSARHFECNQGLPCSQGLFPRASGRLSKTEAWFSGKQRDLISKIEEGAFPNEPNRK